MSSAPEFDFKNVYSTRKAEDRHVESVESEFAALPSKPPLNEALWSTARSAMKSILRKHHARVKFGHDLILDLRDS